MMKEGFLNKVIGICLSINEQSGVAYVEPLWREIIVAEDLEKENPGVSDAEILEVLQLAATKHNVTVDRSKMVINWLYEMLTNTIDPAMLDQENDLMKNMLEYMKANERRDEQMDSKQKVSKMLPGMSFAKGI
jgi:hypothetical protein